MSAYPFNAVDGLDLGPGYRAALLADGPVPVTPPYGSGRCWLVTRHDHARAALADPRLRRSTAAACDAPRAIGRVPGGLVTADPPESTRLRAAVLGWLTPRRARSLRAGIRVRARSRVAALRAQGPPADLVAELALPVPADLAGDLLGLPVVERAWFHARTRALVDAATDPAAAARAMGELTTAVDRLAADAADTDDAADGLVGALVRARDEGTLGPRELAPLVVTVLVGGYEALSALVPDAVLTLLATSGAWSTLGADPSRVPAAVEEVLRHVPLAAAAPFPHVASTALRIGPTTIAAGETVLVALGAADRDPRRFTRPDVLDLDRDAGGHLAFGHGPHRCPGASLARVELQEVLAALLEGMPGLHLAGPVHWRRSGLMRGPGRLPVAW